MDDADTDEWRQKREEGVMGVFRRIYPVSIAAMRVLSILYALECALPWAVKNDHRRSRSYMPERHVHTACLGQACAIATSQALLADTGK